MIKLASLCFAFVATAATAQPTPPTPPAAPTAAPPMRGGAFMPMNPSIEAMNTAIAKLNDETAKPLTGDADHNFATRLAPLSQANIDIAEAELKYGTDAKLKQQAGRIIAAAQREITVAQAWLAKHTPGPGKTPAPGGPQWK